MKRAAPMLTCTIGGDGIQ